MRRVFAALTCLAICQSGAADAPRVLPETPLYSGAIPGAIDGPNLEKSVAAFDLPGFEAVSRPAYTAYLPARAQAAGTAIVLFPGGGYEMLCYGYEGTRIAIALQEKGIAAIVVKYRMPSDATMRDKSIGPLLDAQQAIRVVRAHAGEWGIDPRKVGVMGFSAGGHLASTVSTHFDLDYATGDAASGLRPDFSILVYPVISMGELTHDGSRKALLGPQPSPAQIRSMSSELQVTGATPPALIVAASDDSDVDVGNSIAYYEALRKQRVPAGLVLFPSGEHGFPALPLAQWMAPVWAWLEQSGLARR